MADKETKLSIVLRTVDQATAKIKAINDRLDAVTKPIRNLKDALGDLREKSGLDDVIGGFKGVGSAVGDLLSKVAMIGGVAGVAVAGLFHLVGEFDDLGDKAERVGVGVDFLASMRYAAEKAGAPVDALDNGLGSLSVNLGKLRAGTGRMKTFLDKVSPALERQLKGAKSNEEAFYLLAAAMDKIKDPAKRAALATATLGDASLAPLLNQGEKGVKALAARYIELAGSQEDAANKAGGVDDAMHDLKASTDGVKAALVSGLAPALKVIVERLRDWLQGHRADIKEWAAWLGERLPDAVSTLVDNIRGALGTIGDFVDSIGGWKTVAVALAAVMAGPLVSALTTLGVALLTTPVGWFVAGIAAVAAAAYEIYKHWDGIKKFFSDLWDGVVGVFEAAWNRITGIVDKVKEAADEVFGMGAIDDAVEAINRKQAAEAAAESWRNFNVGVQASKVAGVSNTQITSARVSVDFKNVPRGTSVRTDPQNTADVDLSVGHQMGTP